MHRRFLPHGLWLCLLFGCRDPATVPRETANRVGTASPLPSGPATPLTVGQTATLPHYSLTLVSQRPCAATDAGIPSPKNRLWAVELKIVNRGKGPLLFNPFNVKAVDADRFEYVSSLIGCEPVLHAGVLASGEAMRGFVSFELPSNLSALTLRYRPAAPDQNEETATFHVVL
jgi:hypothetical protein